MTKIYALSTGTLIIRDWEGRKFDLKLTLELFEFLQTWGLPVSRNNIKEQPSYKQKVLIVLCMHNCVPI